MSPQLLHKLTILLAFSTITTVSFSQGKFKVSKKGKKVSTATVYSPGPLFSSDSVLQLKISGKMKDIYRDRKDDATFHPAMLQYANKDGNLTSIGIQLKTRGHFRKIAGNCILPPLLININKSSKLKNSLFQKQDQLKLIMPCLENEDYVIKEYLVYKLYNLFTPLSFNARLVQVEFTDSVSKKKPETHYCFLLEDDKTLAKRNNYLSAIAKRATRTQVDQDEFQLMSLFQLMIGNTDWSIEYLHNLKMLYKDSSAKPITVPYDFDHSGIVNAPYAKPAEELELNSVEDRYFFGNCLHAEEATPYIKRFMALKEKIYATYTSCTLLDAKTIKSVTNYLDEFYKLLNNPKVLEKHLSNGCGNKPRIVIKGYENE
ncbi:MAG: hypothetical protein ABIR81_02420 [Ginsengibacter sp.]